MSTTIGMRKTWLAVFLILFGAFYRVLRAEFLPAMPNFSPVMAIAFCAGLFLPSRVAVGITLASLLVSDMLLNAAYGLSLLNGEMFGIYACYGIAIAVGHFLRNARLPAIFAAVAGNALLFYFVTNTMSWIGNVYYPQNLAGWVQCLTVGRPGFAPTWTFFTNSLISDMIFTSVFVLAVYLARNLNALPSPCRQESSS